MHRTFASSVFLPLQSGIALAVLVGAACSQNPIAPTGAPGGSTALILGAKPGGPPASNYSIGFLAPSGPGSDNGYSPGHLLGAGDPNLAGSFTGSSSTGNLFGSASGPAMLTITGIGPLPEGASTPGPCPEQRDALLLAAPGFLGASHSGTLTVNVDQDGEGGGGFSHSQMTWQMTGISYGGSSWKLNGYSTFSYPAVYDGTAAVFTATLESGVIGINRYPSGSRKADLSVGCRVDLVMTVTQQ
jgi:hypothetical protein